MGEGWHNNHHAYQSSVRQGFRWWEIDPTFYVLKMLSWTGLVWDLKTPPDAVLRNEQRLGSRVIDRAARQLATSFDCDRIALALASSLDGSFYKTLQQRLASAQHQAAEILANARLPHLPTRAEIRARAQATLSATASFEDIVDRAHNVLLEAVGARLVRTAAVQG
jgi:stearoyl-CoA desaturase (delta-9 desaturase)